MAGGQSGKFALLPIEPGHRDVTSNSRNIDRRAIVCANVAIAMYQSCDLVALTRQSRADLAAEKAGRACDQHSHVPRFRKM